MQRGVGVELEPAAVVRRSRPETWAVWGDSTNAANWARSGSRAGTGRAPRPSRPGRSPGRCSRRARAPARRRRTAPWCRPSATVSRSGRAGSRSAEQPASRPAPPARPAPRSARRSVRSPAMVAGRSRRRPMATVGLLDGPDRVTAWRRTTRTWWCSGWAREASTPPRSWPRPGSTWSGWSATWSGGECPFYGCVPSKMMIRAADALGEARRVDRCSPGGRTCGPTGRMVAAPDRPAGHQPLAGRLPRRAARGRPASGSCAGEGRLDGTGPGRGSARTPTSAARGVVLNVGTSPARLPIDGLDATPYWTNREVVKVDRAARLAARDRRGTDRAASSRRRSPGSGPR